MTIDITPEAVENLGNRIDEWWEYQHGHLFTEAATTLRALSAALTASQAETAAAYEVAALTCMGAYPEDGTYEPKDFNIRDAERATVECCQSSIRELTPADSKAALDRMIAEARADGMREALDAASDYTQRVYGDDWKFLSNPIDRERILAAIPKGTHHE